MRPPTTDGGRGAESQARYPTGSVCAPVYESANARAGGSPIAIQNNAISTLCPGGQLIDSLRQGARCIRSSLEYGQYERCLQILVPNIVSEMRNVLQNFAQAKITQ